MTHRELLDVPYAGTERADQTLDAWLVEAEDAPVVIQLHGGGFCTGAKTLGGRSAEAFLRPDWIFGRALAEGISVVSANYRLTTTDPYPAGAEDAARVIQFVRHNAQDWGVDPRRVAVCGMSAGGNMGVRLAFVGDGADPDAADPVARQSTVPDLVVVMHAPADMRRFDLDWVADNHELNREVLEHLGGCALEDYNRTPESRRRVAHASPIDLVHGDGPPLRLIYLDEGGRPHGPVPEFINDPHSAWYGVQLAEALEEVGADYELQVLTEDEWSVEAEAVLAAMRSCLPPTGRDA